MATIDTSDCDKPITGRHRPDIQSTQCKNDSLSTILVGRNELFREGVKSVLTSKNVSVISCVPDLLSVHSLIDRAERCIVLVDCDCNDDISGTIDDAERLHHECPIAQLVVMTDATSSGLSKLLKTHGIKAIVPRTISVDSLLKLMSVVMDGFNVLPTTSFSQLYTNPQSIDDRPQIEADDLSAPVVRTGRPLSDREVAILRCLVSGESNKGIARKLCIAEATVKIHVKGVLRKISVSNRTQAAIWALKHLPSNGNKSTICSDRSGTEESDIVRALMAASGSHHLATA